MSLSTILADSLDTVELVMAFEEEFGCEIRMMPRPS
jgi:acyl carrier protein